MCVYLILNQPLNLKDVLFLICLGELPMLLVWKLWNIQKSGKNSTLSPCMLAPFIWMYKLLPFHHICLVSFLSSLLAWVFVASRGLSLVAVSRGYSLVAVCRRLTAVASLRSWDSRARGLQKLHTFLSTSFHPSISTNYFILNHLSRQCNVLFSKYKDFFQ